MARANGAGVRARVGRGGRWTGAERARYLREFGASGLRAAAFVRQTGLPRSTFDLWRQEERGRGKRPVAGKPREPAGFARVEVLPPAAGAPGLMLVVRTGHGVTAELTGLDAAAAVTLLELLLRGPSR